jgi:uncharacterized protein DUF6134
MLLKMVGKRRILAALRLIAMLGLVIVAAPAGAVTADLASLAPAGTLTYDVYREGQRIGKHTVSFDRMGEELTVRSETDVDFTVFVVMDVSFTHQAVEIWKGNTLQEFTSFTNEDGRKRQVHAQRNGDHLLVTTKGNTRELPANLIPGSLWHPDTVSQHQLLDPIKGRLRKVEVVDRGTETVQANGRKVEARHYSVRGDFKREIWYDRDGTVVKVAFPIKDGSEVILVLK